MLNYLLNLPGNELTRLGANGDFRTRECVELLDEADIVVTNPPFSRFRAFFALLMEHKKRFLIIGSLNAAKYMAVWPHIKAGEVRISGYHRMTFDTPYGEKTLNNCCWFTNLESDCQPEPLPLTALYSPEKYPKYDNYNGIEVPTIAAIPADYAGVMGVPVTFLAVYNPAQYELLAVTETFSAMEAVLDVGYRKDRMDHGGKALLNGREKFCRVLIRKKIKLMEENNGLPNA